jgi:D-alanine-D-alanine ligase-like ATP-grasp enzyme
MLGISKPVMFGFSLNELGDPFVSEIIVSFGLTRHSMLPTIAKLNGIKLYDLVMEAYLGRTVIF